MTYRCVTPRIVAAAETDANGRIRYGSGWFTAPVLQVFAGQPVANLERWLRSLRGSIEELP
jgi:hypothetical protein